MSELKRKAFIRAYLGSAKGNATEAAKIAGYSEKTAYSQGSRLLKDAEVQKAIQKHVSKVDISTERSLERVGIIADAKAEKITAREILKANELLLKVSGALNENRSEARVTVNIGFLTASNVEPRNVTVVASRALVPSSDE
jgi:phage terminase small subunit